VTWVLVHPSPHSSSRMTKSNMLERHAEERFHVLLGIKVPTASNDVAHNVQKEDVVIDPNMVGEHTRDEGESQSGAMKPKS
jgi:hypothetical protein